MNTVAEILRDCAYGLPNAENSETSMLEEEQARMPSPFICDNLEHMAVYGEYAIDDVLKAKNFLHELGMHNSFKEFVMPEDMGIFNLIYSAKHQTLRAWWLLFAADLAEEWGV